MTKKRMRPCSAGESHSETKKQKTHASSSIDSFLLIGSAGINPRLFPLPGDVPASIVPWAENEEIYPDLKKFLLSHNWFSTDEKIADLSERFYNSLSKLNRTYASYPLTTSLLSDVPSRSQKWINVLQSAASSHKDDLATYNSDEERSYQPHSLPVMNLECMAILHVLWFSSGDDISKKNNLVISIQECWRTISNLIEPNKQSAGSSHADDKKIAAKQVMSYSVDDYKRISLEIFRNIENALFSLEDFTPRWHLGLEVMSSVLTMIKFLVMELIYKELDDLDLTFTDNGSANDSEADPFLALFPVCNFH